jgi:hypothetical protein
LTVKTVNYIAYSLWGTEPVYTIGMLRNTIQARTIYPGWQVIVYHDASVPDDILEEIRKEGAKTVRITNGIYGMFWRFYAADLPDCQHVIFRDSDSRLSEREKSAVDAWLRSDKTLHIMRDHPYHLDVIDGKPHKILGGMWGIKGNMLNMRSMIADFAEEKLLQYGSDQLFLNQIYQIFESSMIIHDEFFANSPFPLPRDGFRFIGERYTAEGQPAGDDWKVIKQYYLDRTLTGRTKLQLKKIKKLLKGTK